jgi:hypothetical protein
VIISIDAENTFNKIQHYRIIKALMKLGIEGMYLNTIKAIYDKSIANKIQRKTETISPKVRTETRVPTPSTPTQHSLGNHSQSSNAGKRNKRNRNSCKEELKLFLQVHLETQKRVNSQSNTEQKEQCWRYHNTQFQIILQSHSNKNSMVLAKKQV